MTPVTVMRCETCGDTFPATSNDDEPRCTSCGGTSVHPASEPLL